MGFPMARHLAKEHDVLVWNRTREKAERHAREHGTTLCIIDHKVAFLAEFAHRLIALQNGSKIADGSAQEVLGNPSVISAYLGRQHAGA